MTDTTILMENTTSSILVPFTAKTIIKHNNYTMKKSTLFGALITASLSLNHMAYAQDGEGTAPTIVGYEPAITSLNEINPDDWYILSASSLGDATHLGYVSVNTSHTCDFNQDLYRVTTTLPADGKPETGTDLTHCALQISKGENDTYTFKFYGTEGYYIANQDISAITSGQGYPVHVTTDPTKATFTMTMDENGTIMITSTEQGADKADKFHLNVGGIDTGGLSLWTDGAGFHLYRIITNTDENAKKITYHYTYGEKEVAQATFTLLIGDQLPSPQSLIQLPSYVECSNLTGTVTAQEDSFHIICTPSEDFPFTQSDSFDDATWYALGLSQNNYYLYDTEDAEKMTLGEEQRTYNATDQETFDKQQWCFIGDPFNGFKIYNKHAGSTKILSSTIPSDDNGGTTFPVMTDEASLPEDHNTTWDIIKSTDITGQNGFYIAQHGKDSHKMNYREDSGALSYWFAGANQGSTFHVEDIKTLYESQLAGYVSSSGYVGGFTTAFTEAHQQDIQNLNINTENAATSYISLYNGIKDTISLTSGHYYRIVSAYSPFEEQQSVKKCVYNPNAQDEGTWFVHWGDLDMGSADNVFLIEDAGNGKYLLKNANRNMYIQGVNGGLSADKTAATTNGAFGLSKLAAATYNLKFGNGVMHTNNHSSGAGKDGTLTGWAGGIDTPSAWYIIPATDIEKAIGATGYATLNLPFAVTLPEGVKAYQIKNETESELILEEISAPTIPANTPVMLSAEASHTYTLTVPEEQTAEAMQTGFTGTLVPVTIDTNENAYILAQDPNNQKAKFFTLSSDPNNREIAQNKAYYVSTGNTDAQSFALNFGGTPTSIDQITVNGTDSTSNIYYDLSGRRVLYPTKGFYIKGNGQKVFIK